MPSPDNPTLSVDQTTDTRVGRLDRAEGLKHRLVEFWNAHEPYWDTLTEEVASESSQRKAAASFIPDGSRVLDVACGSAGNAVWLSRRTSYFGSDISHTGLSRTDRSDLRLSCCDADNLPFADGSFDAAISTFALEHSVYPVRMLSEIRRVVRPGGRIVLLGPSWDLPFWYPNALKSRAADPSWRLAYTLRRFFGQLRGLFFGQLPFLQVEDPDAFHRPFEHDADAVYVVWTYEVIRQMKRWGCRLVHWEVGDRMLGTHLAVRLLKRFLFNLPLYRYAGSTVLLVFER